MNKKDKAAVLIVVISALTLSIGLHSALALQVDISGDDWGIYQGDPVFCECYHATQQYWQSDTEVGLGLRAKYTFNGQPVFNWADWMFEDEAGGSGGYSNRMETPMYVDACTNGNNHCYYSDYTAPKWGYVPGTNYQCLYVYLDSQGYFNPVHSVEGRTTAFFYECYNPSHTWWLTAYTQNPPGKSGNGWSFLTAHW